MTLPQNPSPPNWQEIQLDDTWPDAINLKSPSGWVTLVRRVFGKRQTVSLPESLLAHFPIPKYVLQEFHNLPNGNYSRRFSRGYVTGFDISMLGLVDHARAWIAEQLKDCEAVADVGTSGGKTAAAVKAKGVNEVWGIDPSPYLLKHAAHDYPEIAFLHGTAEQLPFPDKRLDGISVCFVFHEIPTRYTIQAFQAFNRCLKLGGKIAISEPSEEQLKPFHWTELRSPKGWLRLYFRGLAHFVYEPFLQAWHKQNKEELAERSGFKLVNKKIDMPINLYLLEKIEDLN